MIEQALGRLSEAALVAAERLRQLLDSDSEKTRLAAAKSVLDVARRLWERRDDELYHRLAADDAQAFAETLVEAVREVVPEPDLQVAIGRKVQETMKAEEARLGALHFEFPQATNCLR
jgi:hypothetical protein